MKEIHKNNEIALCMAFKKELKQLLEKYNASIEVDIPRGKIYASIKVNIGKHENLLKQDYIVRAEDL